MEFTVRIVPWILTDDTKDHVADKNVNSNCRKNILNRQENSHYWKIPLLQDILQSPSFETFGVHLECPPQLLVQNLPEIVQRKYTHFFFFFGRFQHFSAGFNWAFCELILTVARYDVNCTVHLQLRKLNKKNLDRYERSRRSCSYASELSFSDL